MEKEGEKFCDCENSGWLYPVLVIFLPDTTYLIWLGTFKGKHEKPLLSLLNPFFLKNILSSIPKIEVGPVRTDRPFCHMDGMPISANWLTVTAWVWCGFSIFSGYTQCFGEWRQGLDFSWIKKKHFLDLAIVFAIEIRQGEPLCCVSNLKDILLLCRIFI